jgi:hypothetical protein
MKKCDRACRAARGSRKASACAFCDRAYGDTVEVWLLARVQTEKCIMVVSRVPAAPPMQLTKPGSARGQFVG